MSPIIFHEYFILILICLTPNIKIVHLKKQVNSWSLFTHELRVAAQELHKIKSLGIRGWNGGPQKPLPHSCRALDSLILKEWEWVFLKSLGLIGQTCSSIPHPWGYRQHKLDWLDYKTRKEGLKKCLSGGRRLRCSGSSTSQPTNQSKINQSIWDTLRQV